MRFENCCFIIEHKTGALILGAICALDFIFGVASFIAAFTQNNFFNFGGTYLNPVLNDGITQIIFGAFGSYGFFFMYHDNKPATRAQFAKLFWYGTLIGWWYGYFFLNSIWALQTSMQRFECTGDCERI